MLQLYFVDFFRNTAFILGKKKLSRKHNFRLKNYLMRA